MKNKVDQFKSAKFSGGGNSFARALLRNAAEQVPDLPVFGQEFCVADAWYRVKRVLIICILF